MKKLKLFLEKKEFVKFFLMFLSGTLFAQIITIAMSPILTRVYSPKDYGVYGVYLSIVSLFIVFVTGRYEFAINNAKKEKDAVSLYKIVSYLSIITATILLILFLLLDSRILILLEWENPLLLYLIPVTLFLNGLLQGSSYFLNRQKNFKILSKSKIYQSLGNAGVGITAGYMGFGAFGLILGNITSLFIAQLYQRICGIKLQEKIEGYKTLIFNLKKYKQYPIFNAPSAFFDAIAIQSPVFILLKFFNETIIGFYSLTVRVIGLPLSLISTSLSQVFLSQVSELHRANKSYKKTIIRAARYLAMLGSIPLAILIFFSPALFSFVFGEKWEIAGEFARILSIGYYFKFFVSPLSIVFFINQRVRLLSVLQTLRAISTTIVLIVFSSLYEIKTVLWAFSIHELVFYLIYLKYIIKTSK